LVQRALASERGYWSSESDGDEPPRWEGICCTSGTFWVEPGNHFCLVSLPVRYSQFLSRGAEAVECVNALEEWLLKKFPANSVLRIDEFVRLQWQHYVGITWWQGRLPIEEFLEWSHNQSADIRFHCAIVAVSKDLDLQIHPTSSLGVITDLIESFSSPSLRSQATHQLAMLGPATIPVLRSIIEGTLRNRYGHLRVPIGTEEFRCALVTIRLLGPLAIDLEEIVAKVARTTFGTCAVEAISALAAMEWKTDESLRLLADALTGASDTALEAARAITRARREHDPIVTEKLADSERARNVLERYVRSQD
jgi:hypothetical protein